MYYVIGDIHGQKDLLVLAMNYIYENGGKKVIFLGDYIDRGPDSLGVVDIVMNPPEGVEFITLMGNHEEMFVNDGKFDYFYCDIFKNEVYNNSLSYDQKCWFYNLKPLHIEDDNIFAHAAYDPTVGIDEQKTSYLFWLRYNRGEKFHSDKYHLTHGHTPYSDGPDTGRNRTNLDCKTKNGQQICVGVYEKGVKGPVKFCMIQKDGSRIEFKPTIL